MRYEKLIVRDNGIVVKLITIGNLSVFTKNPQIDMFAIVCDQYGNETYHYQDNNQNKSLDGLSVDEYIKRGRKGLLAVVKPNEIICSILEIRRMLAL